ncbi:MULTISPECIES: class I SAM-dependent methyltransferase [unclassified Streptomyces]|uniref:class I SAM-dependent methyltransferase n=1 Tax=unclassified Streptomyces TaxID=2593676 RepID=UPI001F038090|nr:MULTISPECIES: class I SAM-dependent methyltransferase [unclassified Streptomyces]MCH0563418.1 class I SAM-dependent methyltransferase [Streptomyces sp. MUM 2J]MCH0571474.1 class I SAM-dependent methyltransferase [Streptomyces sp. MUM 136J]
MSVTSRYRAAWEGFWQEVPDEQGAALWDASPAVTARLHLALFRPHLADPELPLVDLGCGNGTQTRFLAEHFARVVGADLSAAALEHARHADPAGRARYRQLDAADEAGTEALHTELGDANVYLRGVIHQCEPDDRQPFADAVAALVGTRGRAFVVELAEAAGVALQGLAASPAGPPAKLAPVLRHGIAPAEVTDAALPEYLRAAGLTVLASGELPLTTTEAGPDGAPIRLPSRWLVAGRTG